MKVPDHKKHLFEPANGHSPVGPSSLSRVLKCPGSVEKSHGRPDRSSRYAEEGSRAHEVAEAAVWDCVLPVTGFRKSRVESLMEKDEYDTDMRECAESYVDYVIAQIADTPRDQVKVFVERGWDFDRLMPNGFGTADLVVVSEEELHVFDYKYGVGVEVSAENNTQLLAYLEAADHELWPLYGYDRLVVHICQPRINHYDSWEVTQEDLDKYRMQVKAAAELIVSDNPPVVPGEEQCRWCLASGDCAEQYEHMQKTMSSEFDDIVEDDDFPDLVRELNHEQLASAAAAIPQIKKFIESVETRVLDELKQGHDVPGFKLVRGRRGMRTWDEPDHAREELESTLKTLGLDPADLVKPAELKSPAQVEKLLPKDKRDCLEPLVSQAEGKLAFAPETDKREAIDPAHEFEESA